MRLVVRSIHLALLTMFIFGVLLQAFSAGRYIFGISADNDLHAGIGWPLAHMFAPIVLILSFFTKGGWKVYGGMIGAVVITAVMPMVALLDEDGPMAAEALHPVMALVLVGILTWQWQLGLGMVRHANATQPVAVAPKPTPPATPSRPATMAPRRPGP